MNRFPRITLCICAALHNLSWPVHAAEDGNVSPLPPKLTPEEVAAAAALSDRVAKLKSLAEKLDNPAEMKLRKPVTDAIIAFNANAADEAAMGVILREMKTESFPGAKYVIVHRIRMNARSIPLLTAILRNKDDERVQIAAAHRLQPYAPSEKAIADAFVDVITDSANVPAVRSSAAQALALSTENDKRYFDAVFDYVIKDPSGPSFATNFLKTYRPAVFGSMMERIQTWDKKLYDLIQKRGDAFRRAPTSLKPAGD
jgi:hypothetical protein